jgi:putative transcriptional regulator
MSDKSPAAIAGDIGNRLKQARLNANLTQAELAEKASLSIKVVQSTEKGKAMLDTLVAYLQALGMDSQIDLFVPRVEISPVQLAKLKGKTRQRASGLESKTDDNEGADSW